MENTSNISRYQLESDRLVDQPTIVKMIGDTTTICQVVQLLAYIRNVIKNNEKKTLSITIGKHIQNGKFLFDVNGSAIPDLIAENTFEIN